MVEGERTLLVQGAGGGQTWVFGPWSESADAKDDDCGCTDDECDACAEIALASAVVVEFGAASAV